MGFGRTGSEPLGITAIKTALDTVARCCKRPDAAVFLPDIKKLKFLDKDNAE